MGKLHFEKLTGVSRTCQQEPPAGRPEGAREGRCSSRFITIGEFSAMPDSTGGRGRLEAERFTSTIVYAPSGVVPAENATFLRRARAHLGRMASTAEAGVAGGGFQPALVDETGMAAAGVSLVEQLQGMVERAVLTTDLPFFMRAAASIYSLAQPEVAVPGDVHFARNADELTQGWDRMATQVKDHVSRQPPPANQLLHGELARGALAAPEFPEEEDPQGFVPPFPDAAVRPMQPPSPPSGGVPLAPRPPPQSAAAVLGLPLSGPVQPALPLPVCPSPVRKYI